MSRSRRFFLLPALAVCAALLGASPASAWPGLADSGSAWSRFLEPLARLRALFDPQGWAIDPAGRTAVARPGDREPSGLFGNQGWALDPNGLVSPPPSNQGASPPPHD